MTIDTFLAETGAWHFDDAPVGSDAHTCDACAESTFCACGLPPEFKLLQWAGGCIDDLPSVQLARLLHSGCTVLEVHDCVEVIGGYWHGYENALQGYLDAASRLFEAHAEGLLSSNALDDALGTHLQALQALQCRK